ncbi:MAG: AAA family ATPase [Desulfatibacillaceae bacterium]
MVEVEKVIVGQKAMIEKLLVALLCDGHILLEGLPGLAKTTAVKSLAAAVDVGFRRIQFTPDLLPADILGTRIYRPDTCTFEIRQGPIFDNIILADEINRAPAKVQSALLEAMSERQVTVAGETFRVPDPFMVLATQNPIEQEGTYPLPEAQVDRFMLKVLIGYPSSAEEKEIMARAHARVDEKVVAKVDPKSLVDAKGVIKEIHMEQKIVDYIVDLVHATRDPEAHGVDAGNLVRYGASPRASIYLGMAARAHAFLNGRGYVIPQDVKYMAPDVLRHRVILSYEAEAEGVTPDDVVGRILERVEVP